MKKIISTPNAPQAIGPYSQAVRAGDFLFISGQLGLVPQTGALEEGIEAQTKRAMENIGAILKEAGGGFENVVKTTILLADISDFPKVNEIYSQYFSNDFPARATFAVAALPKEALIEIEAIAYFGK
ncbi:MAG: RidA family protein [Spirochaetota bacterium]